MNECLKRPSFWPPVWPPTPYRPPHPLHSHSSIINIIEQQYWFTLQGADSAPPRQVMTWGNALYMNIVTMTTGAE